MKAIPASSTATFLTINAGIVPGAIAGSMAFSRLFGIGFSSFIPWTIGFVVFYGGNLMFAWAWLRFHSWPVGPVRPGTRFDHVYGVYQLLYVFFLYPISFSRLLAPPFTSLWHRFIGARIGKNSFPSAALICEGQYVSLGDHVTLGANCMLSPHIMTGERLTMGRIVVGDHATVGPNSIVYGDVEIGDGALVLANSAVTPGTRIGPDEMWGGNPVRKVRDIRPGESAWQERERKCQAMHAPVFAQAQEP